MQQSVALFAQTSTSNHTVDAHNNLVSLYHDWGLPHSGLLALKHGYKALSLAHTADSPSWVLDALVTTAMAEIAFGSLPKALELLSQAEPLAQQLNTPYQIYVLAWAKARAMSKLGHTDQAFGHFQTAQAGAERLQHVLDAHKIGLEIAHLSGDLKAAQQHLEWFEKGGLHNGANFARRLFPELAALVEAEDSTPSAISVRLEALGPMQITLNGERALVRGRKRQELLALLLEAHLGGRSEVSRLRLLETLYPEEDELKASAALKQLVSSLRESLGEPAIRTTGAGYALGAVASDAEDFLKTGQTKLWRGNYLEGLDISNFDSGVADSLYLSLKLKADELLSLDSKEAARLGRMLLEFDPYSHQYLELCLQAFRASDNYKSASRVYHQARERMREVGETLPPQWTDFMVARG